MTNVDRHGDPSSPFEVQNLPPGATGQAIVPHSPSAGSQLTSHRHELRQLIPPHADIPVQVVEHRPVPHVTLPQALPAVQCTSHDLAAVHVMSPHAPLLVHSTTQAQPAGQAIAPLPTPSIVQVWVAKLHALHTDGQVRGASIGRLASGVPTTQ